MRLTVELDDAIPDCRLRAILDELAAHRPYVIGAELSAEPVPAEP